jgi:hypothetical protein
MKNFATEVIPLQNVHKGNIQPRKFAFNPIQPTMEDSQLGHLTQTTHNCFEYHWNGK